MEPQSLLTRKRLDRQVIVRQLARRYRLILDHFEGNIEENYLDLDEGNRRLCDACALPVFSTPLKNADRNGTPFWFHKDCAHLPKTLKHVLHPKQPLVLNETHPSLRQRRIRCRNCQLRCEGFVFRCSDFMCGFVLDVLCAMPLGPIKLLHRSHNHELFLIRGKTLVTCGACETKHEGESYLCYLCNFWIHRECALLPNPISHSEHDIHQHSLRLTYASRKHSLRFQRFDSCFICKAKIASLGAYFCTRCEHIAHIKCAISDPNLFSHVSSEDAVGSLIHLPMPNEQMSVVEYLLENRWSSRSSENEDERNDDKIVSKETIHDHPLILRDEDYEGRGLCNACVQPISQPFYSCSQCHDFLLHRRCANLPLHFHHPQHECDIPLQLQRSRKFFSRFTCDGCVRPCNGLVYSCLNCEFELDVECASLPDTFTHEAHIKTHVLYLTLHRQSAKEVCQCCGKHLNRLCYECSSCRYFKLHVRCALLPTSLRHKFDKHPLSLVAPVVPSSTCTNEEDDGKHFCEICEKGLQTKRWFYQCKLCDQSFHIDCIPCVGKYSKIKFGGTIRVRCHHCPLTSVRMLTKYSYSCGLCMQTMQGMEDGIAFECSKCYFWMHYGRARKNMVS